MCARVGGGAFKCARRSAVLSVSQRCLRLKTKPACWSGGNTQENQSYNYPDFLCHLKQRRTLSLTAVLARGRASVTVLISANFVIGSMVPSILPAASRVVHGERARPRERQKEILEFSSQRRKEIIAEKHQTQRPFTEPCAIFQPSLLTPFAFDLQNNIFFNQLIINLYQGFARPWTLPPAGLACHCMLCAQQNVLGDI